ncbi:MAG: ADP-ribosylation factor-like protein [Candidatus Heimdallarchaeaceae archaeon]
MDIKQKLVKEKYRKEENIKNLPVFALLDIRENESNILKEFKLETVEQLAENWKEHYDELTKKFPKERIDSWIAASRLLLVEDTEKVTTGAKIILAGIDNAGKTSLSIALKHRGAFSLLFQKLNALTPTRGLLRGKLDVFGLDIHLHELGGQKIYREDYLQNPEQYFIGTDIIIYVVDVQAEDRYEESFEYLKQIVGVTKELKIEVPWRIFFHKSDPDFHLSDKANAIFGSMVQYMESHLPLFDPAKSIFRTSVHIRSSILGAFSHIFRDVSLIQDYVMNASKQVAETLNAEFFGLYDFRSNVCFAQYSKNEKLEELAHNAYYEAIETIANLREPFLRIRRYILDDEKKTNEIFILRDLKFRNERYIMALLTSDESVARNLDQDEVENIIDRHLEDWIEFRGYAKFPMGI